MDSRFRMRKQPDLHAPYLLVGFRGWLNAGEVSTGSIDYLRRKLNATPFAQIDPNDFYIHQIPTAGPEQNLRPHAKIEEGLVSMLDMPQNEFFFWRNDSGHDLILFSGIEPNLDWPAYARIILDVAQHFQAKRIYALGGVFDQVPHTRDTRLFAVVSHPRLKEAFRTFAPFLNYEGPCSFTTMLLYLAGKHGVEAAGITARTPLYIQNYNAKACYDLLRTVLALTPYDIDLNDLRQAGESLMETMDNAFAQNPAAMEQLRKMEELFDTFQHEMTGQGYGEDFDTLMEEILQMKKNGRKLH